MTSRLQESSEWNPQEDSSCVDRYSLLKLVDLLIVICQLCGKEEKVLLILPRTKEYKLNSINLTNTHTASKSVFTIMLMNCRYLLQQHLHLLRAVGDKRSESKHRKATTSAWSFESQEYLLSLASASANLACSICRWSSRFWNSWMPAAYMGRCSWTWRDSSHRLWHLIQRITSLPQD